jgi:hypothetical protein
MEFIRILAVTILDQMIENDFYFLLLILIFLHIYMYIFIYIIMCTCAYVMYLDPLHSSVSPSLYC